MSITGEAPVLRAGVRLRGGRYLLVAPLGRGGFASVWRARDTRTRQEVALKLLPAEDGGRESAEREAEVTARVRHPNVVRVLDTFCEDGWAGIVMELAAVSLADLVAEQGPLPPEAALAAVLKACAGLAEAHAAGVVHRDVKPHNLLLFPDGTVKVGDFGAARTVGHTRTRTANVLGSIPFMAPEQRRDPRAVRPATDVYALAVTTAWLVTGHAPGDLFAPGNLGELVEAGVPVGLAEALARAGAHDARERPPEAGALAEVLRGCGVVADAGALRGLAEGVGAGAGTQPEAGEGGSVSPGAGELGIHGAGGSTPRNAPRGLTWGWARPAAITALLAAVGAAGWALRDASGPLDRTLPAEDAALPRCTNLPVDFRPLRANGPREVVAAAFDDVNADGFDDALFTSQLDKQVLIYFGGPDARLENPLVIPTRRSGLPAHAVDIDGDGTNEILLAHRDEATWAAYAWTGEQVGALRGEWPEAPVPLAEWDVVRRTDGPASVVYPSSTDGCVMERVIANGGLEPAMCAWRTTSQTVTAVRSHSSRMVSVAFQDGGGVWLDTASQTLIERIPTDLPLDFMNQPLMISVLGLNRFQLNTIEDRQPCRGPKLSHAASNVGDWNGDGFIDSIGSITCAGCTSELMVAVGYR